MRRPNSKRLLVVSLLMFVLFLLLIAFDTFSHVRPVITDKLYGGQDALSSVIVVGIDDKSIHSVGRWPWDRDVYVDFLEKVNDAKVVAFDISFFEDSSHDVLLQSALDNFSAPVIFASEIHDDILYTPVFAVDHGYANIPAQTDGVVRKVHAQLHERELPLAFAAYDVVYGLDATKPSLWINFVGPPETFTTYSFVNVLASDIDFSNAVVFVGATAANLHDTYFVPTSSGVPMPGVEIHATIFQNLLLNSFVTYQPVSSIALFVFIVALLSVFVFSRLNTPVVIGIVIGIFVVYTVVAIISFNVWNYLLDMFFVPLALLCFTGVSVGVRYYEERKHSSYLTSAFGKYISKDLLQEIVHERHHLGLGGDKRTITVFFSDIRGFTSISEKLDPEQLVHLLNEYLTGMTSVIMEQKGMVDKFIGDAIMAIWNAPLELKDHARYGCLAAIEQVKKLTVLQKKWKKDGVPLLQIGCGLHTGPAVVGNMGSSERFDYTAIGDTVNLSARLESLTKTYGVSIIVSEATYRLVKDDFLFRKLDVVAVKGKKKPVSIYELVLDGDKEFVACYEKGISLYLDRKFREAKKQFSLCLKQRKDVASDLFIQRCDDYISNPPDKEWSGAFIMQHK